MVFSSLVKMVAQYTQSSCNVSYLFPQSNRGKAQPSLVTGVSVSASERARERGAKPREE